MSEIEGHAVRKNGKYANENISETLGSRVSFGYGTPLLFLCEMDSFLLWMGFINISSSAAHSS